LLFHLRQARLELIDVGLEHLTQFFVIGAAQLLAAQLQLQLDLQRLAVGDDNVLQLGEIAPELGHPLGVGSNVRLRHDCSTR
jgi:hypothetical protein